MRTFLSAVFCLLSAAALTAADAGGCATVQKALENVVTTPAHVYTTETSSQRGAAETETIYLDGKVYVLMNAGGRWTLSPVTAVQMADTMRKNRRHATLACKIVGEEKVGDRLTTVYTTSKRTSDSQTDSRVWIDKASGLLLKQEETLTAGKDNTVHRSVRYEYGNVSAPKIPSD
jgi:outer membrane lipoprotein-sorting protein